MNLAVVRERPQLLPKGKPSDSLQVFSTCPSSSAATKDYVHHVAEVARWSERAGCAGVLVYTDNTLVDPWLVSQVIIQNTESLCPLVAVQPAYMHPYSVAKMVSSLAFLHGRRVFLNMVAGGFKNDLAALSDTTPHDSRYRRLVEYTEIIQRLIEGETVTFEGDFYAVHGLKLSPCVGPELRPGILVSGSSEPGMEAARELGAIAVKYPEPPDRAEAELPRGSGPCGLRVGIVARPNGQEAWTVALERFPEDRTGQLTRQLANKVSDSAWHKRLSGIGKESAGTRDTYWLRPFENYQTNCPYLVGSYASVAEELAHYIRLGYRTYILDIPLAEEEFKHTGRVFQIAWRRAWL
jgi:alkanesulfonate monooxygenase